MQSVKMSNLLRRWAVQNVARCARNSSDHTPAHFKPATMDDLPVPCGSWQDHYNAKQAKYNKHLFLGTGFFIFTVIVCKSSNLFFFNWGPPPIPEGGL